MSCQPKISIITVVYNDAKNIEKTILSVLGQSFRNIEYIIIDGGSTDGTVEIIKKYSRNLGYSISEKDKGIYDAMNKGLNAAAGDYVLFLNSGDTFYENNSLGKIPFHKYPNADIFYGETIILDEGGNQLGLRRKKLPQNLSWKHFKRGMIVCHQSILVKKEIAPEYDLKYAYTSDIDWVITSLKASKQTIFTHSVISNFTQGGFSGNNLKKSWIDRFIILKKNFGMCQCILSHIVFIFENILLKAKIIPLHRKINLQKLQK